MEWVTVATDTILAIAGITASAVAVWGLTAWRRELTARRRAELAEQTLAMFYEARDLLAWVRTAGSFGGEGESREPEPNETEDDTRYRNATYVPIERLSHQAEFWGRFDAGRYPFMAVFGETNAEPFQTIREIRNRVRISAGMLLRTHGQVNEDRPERQQQWEKWEDDIGWGPIENDKLAPKIDRAVSDIEAVCRPAITGSGEKSN